jgi:RecB family exonuclease
MDDDVSLERAWSELNGQRRRGEAAATTVEALAYSLIRSARVEGFLIDRLEIAKDGRIIVYAGKQESSPSAATNSADEQPCP